MLYIYLTAIEAADFRNKTCDYLTRYDILLKMKLPNGKQLHKSSLSFNHQL